MDSYSSAYSHQSTSLDSFHHLPCLVLFLKSGLKSHFKQLHFDLFSCRNKINKLPVVQVGTAGVNVMLSITLEGKYTSFSEEKKRKKHRLKSFVCQWILSLSLCVYGSYGLLWWLTKLVDNKTYDPPQEFPESVPFNP